MSIADVLDGRESWHVQVGDVLDVLRMMPTNSVDLVFCSPPYEDARTYGIDYKLRGQDWVDWAVERFVECVRVSRGLVAWVVEGKTKQFRWSATPALFMVDLHRRGVCLRKPPAFRRVGIPGSGGPDWLRNDYEFIVCATSGGKLPWSDNTAMGHPPKWAPGGAMSNRHADGQRKNARDKVESRAARVNQWGHSIDSGATVVKSDGRVRSHGTRPSHYIKTFPAAKRDHTKARKDGSVEVQHYSAPKKANPGNVIECTVGGGVMGSKLAHENEAPFPEALAEFFVRSFCPPGGITCDPFSGSGTTIAVARKFGRRGIGVDIRESQVELSCRRVQYDAPLFSDHIARAQKGESMTALAKPPRSARYAQMSELLDEWSSEPGDFDSRVGPMIEEAVEGATMSDIDKLTDDELNRAAAELMGWTNVHSAYGATYGFPPAASVWRRFDPVNNDNSANELLKKILRDHKGMWHTSWWNGLEQWLVEIFDHPDGSNTWTVSATDESYGRAVVRACLEAESK